MELSDKEVRERIGFLEQKSENLKELFQDNQTECYLADEAQDFDEVVECLEELLKLRKEKKS